MTKEIYWFQILSEKGEPTAEYTIADTLREAKRILSKKIKILKLNPNSTIKMCDVQP